MKPYAQAYRNILSDELFNECVAYLKEHKDSGENCFTNSHHVWEDVIKQDSPPVIILPVKEGVIYDKLNEFVEKKFNQKIKQMFFHIMFPGTHIGWHNDGSHKSALSIYLNETWDRNHGGLFLFEQDNKYGALVPEKNLGVYQAGGVWHAVSVLTKNSQFRESIQIFME